MEFGTTVDPNDFKIENEILRQKAVGPISFRCSYNSVVTLERDFVATYISAQGFKTDQTGRFDPTFDLQVYTDSGLTDLVTSDSNIYLGSTLYAQVKWAVESLENKSRC